MKHSEIARLSFAALLASALASSTGCSIFGGGGDEDMNGSGGFSDGSGSSDGTIGGGNDGFGSEGIPGRGQQVAELETIYFDYDRALVRDDQKPTLRSNSEAIVSNTSWRTVVIEGHTDERGTEEYNLALGERRANAARQYLIDSGIPSARLDTVSFGEAQAAAQGHDESAWKWNRRAEFRVIR
jgi:peptidoglycan-associated lipoprotein